MDIRIKAGKKAFEIIRGGGFNFERITTFVGPAVGPRWLIASGFDMTLLKEGILGRSKPVLLAGTSAGAFRFAAWLQPEPLKSYQKLIESYTSIHHSRADTPDTIMEAMSRVLNSYVETDAIPFALTNRRYRLSITTARARHIAASETHWLQKVGLAAAYICNAVNRSFLHGFYERVVFYYAPIPPRFCLRSDFRGKAVPLNTINFKNAILASGSIPLVVAGVKNIYGAPNGVYRDGGLFDYHLNQEYTYKEGEITLFFHHQERIVPGWLDKNLNKRRPPESFLDNVLMIYPSEEFIKKLPGGKVPERDDFVTFIDEPGTRIKNWRKAVELCTHLGERFLEIVESGKISQVVERF